MLSTLPRRIVICLFLLLLVSACGREQSAQPVSLVLAGGSGGEEAMARKQLAAFAALHPDIQVSYQATPSSASERHTLYVTWLSSGSDAVDLLNLDVIWAPEFAAAGWLKPLDDQVRRDRLPLDDFLPAALTASRYRGRLYALPWFVDVGLFYYRTDLYAAAGLPPPRTFADLLQIASLKEKFNLPYGFLFQGQAYEGLVTVACEFFWGNGGRIFDDAGNLVLDSPQNRRALQFLVDLIYVHQVSPLAVTTFLEEDCRHAFEQGNAVAMRNWPYAYVIMNEPGSRVAGKFALLPPPHGPGGSSTSAFGGGVLGINAFSRHPRAAWQLLQFLLSPGRIKERSLGLGMLPPLQSLYHDPDLVHAFPFLKDLRQVFWSARPRPNSPLYSLISDILRIHLARALTRQEEPAAALRLAQARILQVLQRFSPKGSLP
jgi:multiple sugar transport system substrate-binding protein